MSKNLYTEYVFTKHDYEQALIELHAILYNIALRNQALLRSISSYDFSENSEAIRNEANMLYKQATACVEKILNMGYDLSERLKQADSYQAVFADLKTKSMQELISTMRTKYNYAIVDEAATPYVPEQDITSKNEMNNNERNSAKNRTRSHNTRTNYIPTILGFLERNKSSFSLNPKILTAFSFSNFLFSFVHIFSKL